MRFKLFAVLGAGATIAVGGLAQAGAHPLGSARPAAHAASVAHSAHAKPVLKLASTLVGTLLVDHRGYTIFMFTKDKRNRDVCAQIKGCLTDWPAVTTSGKGKPPIGPGVKPSLVGTIPYKGKLRMLTYKGYPLHTYKFDYAPGTVMNIGNTQFGGSWWGLTAAGTLVK